MNKELITYRKNKKEIIIKCLNRLEESSSLSSEGKPKITLSFYYYFIKEIFLENIIFFNDLPESTRRKILHLSISRWIKYKKVDNPNQKIKLFLNAVNYEYKKAVNQIRKYSVLMFLNIDRNSIKDFWDISILGETQKLISWNDIPKFGIQNLWEIINLQNKNNSILIKEIETDKPTPDIFTFTPFLYEVKTFDSGAALEIASEKLDLFRAIVNMSLVIHRYTYFRSEPIALSKILPSPIYVILCDNKIDNIYSPVDKYKYKNESVPNNKLDFIKSLTSKFEVTPQAKSTWNFLRSILLLYQNSLDIVSPEFTFLSIWQVLENCLTLNETSINNQQILTRVKQLINCDPFVLEMVEILINTRNKYVHKGSYLEEGDSLLFNLKIITDEVIYQLIRLAEIYPSMPELQEYFSLNSLGNSDLKRKVNVIESILKIRNFTDNL